MEYNKMNNKKKVTAESALEDFKKVMVFNLVNKINTFFDGNVRAFWTAQSEMRKFDERCETWGRQSPQLTHRVYRNLELFDNCGLSVDAVKAIFRNVPNYPKLIEKYRVAKHGTLMTGNGDNAHRKHYKTVYRTETMKELTDIFENEYLLRAVLNLRGTHYTKRQKHIIIKYIAPAKEGKKGNFSLEKCVKSMLQQNTTPIKKLDEMEMDNLDDELDEFFNDNRDIGG